MDEEGAGDKNSKCEGGAAEGGARVEKVWVVSKCTYDIEGGVRVNRQVGTGQRVPIFKPD